MTQFPTTRHQYQDVTHPRVLLDNALDNALNSILPQPSQSRASSPPPVVSDLGSLGKLPLDILQEILPQLDLRTLTDLQYVNRCAADVVRHLPQFKLLTKHARNVLRGALAIETGHYVTCDQVLVLLHDFECFYCRGFGGYLYLLACKRVCYRCFLQDNRLRPVTPNQAQLRFGLSDEALEGVPRMRYVPGTYGISKVRFEERGEVVDDEGAELAGITLHGSRAAMQDYLIRTSKERVKKYGGPPEMRLLLRREIIDVGRPNPSRFVAICEVPWIDEGSGEVNWGFRCAGCHGVSDTGRSSSTWWELFNVQTFEQHIGWAGGILPGERHEWARG